jgi:hypothetical protein
VSLPGLQDGQRFRCVACGNLTRFDVVTVERTRWYWHAGLSGTGRAEEEHRLGATIESVTCRWCGPSGRIEIVDAPSGRPEAGAG